MPNFGFLSRLSTKLCLLLLVLGFFLALCEGVVRLAGFDFAKEEESWRSIPPYYRQPIVPVGEVYFRRPGPQEWSGQVLNSMLTQRRIQPNPYADEPVVIARYNGEGFRNPEDLTDWEIAVTGDSFTELGYLDYGDLFTTKLGEILGTRVLNLGVSMTGPLSQLCYLREYGIADGTKQAVIVFFEGNDLDELALEAEALKQWEETGERPYREFKKQPSLLKALFGLIKELRGPAERTDYVDAWFTAADDDIPVTLSYAPPDGATVSDESRRQLEAVLSAYAEFGKEQKIEVWLAFMPCKRRVLDGHLEFADGINRNIREWKSSDLPQFVAGLCDARGIGFIDLTLPLIEETRETKALLYQPIYDTHVNARGSHIVARELARHLGESASDRRGRGPRQVRP